jgi:hypothetical protein
MRDDEGIEPEAEAASYWIVTIGLALIVVVLTLSRMTAWRYMRLSEMYEQGGDRIAGATIDTDTLTELTQGQKTRRAKKRKKSKPLTDAIADVDVDYLAAERETRDKEVTLHRDLALELIDIGYKALATRLHPDVGGSRDAMRRLNRVRDELKDMAKTRRFE